MIRTIPVSPCATPSPEPALQVLVRVTVIDLTSSGHSCSVEEPLLIEFELAFVRLVDDLYRNIRTAYEICLLIRIKIPQSSVFQDLLRESQLSFRINGDDKYPAGREQLVLRCLRFFHVILHAVCRRNRNIRIIHSIRTRLAVRILVSAYMLRTACICKEFKFGA